MSCSRRIRRLSEGTIFIGELPQGCKLCLKGAKMVLFLTGLCDRHCWYCPISPAKRGRDVIYANERKVSTLEEVVEEAELMDAEGTGITGGEPLMVPERLLEVIRELKRRLGKDHHIHLYTNGLRLTKAFLKRLHDAGLDELRIHPVNFEVCHKISWAKELGISSGAETPVIPGMKEYYMKLFILLDKIGADFVNLNELELSEGNYLAMKLRGIKLKEGSQVAAEGSEELAMQLLRWALENTGLNVHYCPASVKDRVQFRERLRRIALKRKLPHEEVDEEGLIVKGVIYCSRDIAERIIRRLQKLGLELVLYNKRKGRVEFHISAVKEVLQNLRALGLTRVKVGILREYPDRDLEVEFYPLN